MYLINMIKKNIRKRVLFGIRLLPYNRCRLASGYGSLQQPFRLLRRNGVQRQYLQQASCDQEITSNT